MKLRIFPDAESLSRSAAELFVTIASEALDARGRFVAALSGGETPRRTYELLAGPPFAERVDWSRTHVFWCDERCVPPDDARSNERMIRRALLDRVPIPSAQTHPFRCAENPEQSAASYEKELIRYFGSEPPAFDLALLGLGLDGHTASILPHSGVLFRGGAWTAVVRRGEEDFARLTMSPTLLNNSREAVFLVSGIDKAAVLKETIEGSLEPDRLPAQQIRPRGNLTWLVDRQAASMLTRGGDGP